ncbi:MULTISPECIES: oligosaccharide flippase family protein [Weeksellaceae]|uniref:lipopolysaccharide biosynthesis protein n=1 Tax=Weeksellaceae TaxID=2762318 RepID=UPI00289B1644|nr:MULTISPECIES: oligosaccharide flippase family protein [Weeksellaceae]
MIINIFLSFLFKGGNMVINFILVPITINLLTSNEYGLWLTLSSIIAWFGISDIGLGNGLRNRFAEAVANNDKYKAREYVSTTYFVISVFIIIVWSLFSFINIYIDWTSLLNLDSTLKEDLSQTMFILISFFSVQFIVNIINTILYANQEPGRVAKNSFLGNLLVLICIQVLVLLKIKGSLVLFAIITNIFPLIVTLILTFIMFNGSLKDYRPSLKLVRLKYMNDLMNLGLKFFFIQISMIFILQSTNILITRLLGANEVTVFNIAYRYFSIPLTISLIIFSPLWSAFTDAYSKNDFNWIKKIYVKANYFMACIIFSYIIFFLLSDYIYNIWIGKKVIIPFKVSFLMMIYMIFLTYFSSFILLINGIGKLKIQLYLYVISAPIYIFLANILGTKYELNGIIISNIIIYLIFSFFTYYQLNKLINNKAKGIWNK